MPAAISVLLVHCLTNCISDVTLGAHTLSIDAILFCQLAKLTQRQGAEWTFGEILIFIGNFVLQDVFLIWVRQVHTRDDGLLVVVHRPALVFEDSFKCTSRNFGSQIAFADSDHSGHLRSFAGVRNISDDDLISSFKAGQTNHRDFGLDVDRVKLTMGSNSHTSVSDSHLGAVANLTSHQIRLLRSSAKPSAAQITLRDHGKGIGRDERLGCASFINKLLGVDLDGQTQVLLQIATNHRLVQSGLAVGQNEVALDDGIVLQEVVESGTITDGTCRTNTSLILDQILPGLDITHDISSRIGPRSGGLNLVCAGDAIVVIVVLAIGTDSNQTSCQQLHTHALTLSTSTFQQSSLVVKNIVHDRIHIGRIVGLQNHVQFLTSLFIDQDTLFEEWHVGGNGAEANAVTDLDLGIIGTGIQHDGKTLGTLDPLQVQTTLLTSGKQRLTQIWATLICHGVPIGNQLTGSDKFENCHMCIPPCICWLHCCKDFYFTKMMCFRAALTSVVISAWVAESSLLRSTTPATRTVPFCFAPEASTSCSSRPTASEAPEVVFAAVKPVFRAVRSPAIGVPASSFLSFATTQEKAMAFSGAQRMLLGVVAVLVVIPD
nr:MAG TPA: hypothetical protein [Caudoviricetes sp.]